MRMLRWYSCMCSLAVCASCTRSIWYRRRGMILVVASTVILIVSTI